MKAKWIILAIGMVTVAASAQEREQLSREELAAQFPGMDVKDIHEAALPGLYEVSMGSSVAYVSKDGRYVLQGDLYDLEENANLTEKRRSTAREAMLSRVDPATMIVFSPGADAVKYTVTVFTDIDCGYCRQFHRDIDKVTAMGIEVHYLSYPRTGPDTESWAKAEKVWCAEDRKAALTDAKLGGHVPEETCESSPVASHYELGNDIGVRGTPSIFAANGEQLGGYVTPEQLLELLEGMDSE